MATTSASAADQIPCQRTSSSPNQRPGDRPLPVCLNLRKLFTDKKTVCMSRMFSLLGPCFCFFFFFPDSQCWSTLLQLRMGSSSTVNKVPSHAAADAGTETDAAVVLTATAITTNHGQKQAAVLLRFCEGHSRNHCPHLKETMM